MKRLTMKLDTKSIKNAIKELEEYKMSLRTKNELFVSRLIDEGIRIADRNVGYGKYISVTKEMENDGARTIGFLIAKDTKKIHAEWDYYGQKKTAELSLTSSQKSPKLQRSSALIISSSMMITPILKTTLHQSLMHKEF